MDRIFSNLGDGPEREPGDEYEYRVRALIEDARSFEESDLAPGREENQEYYYGLRPVLEPLPQLPGDMAQPYNLNEQQDAGRSTVVSTDVRDTVMAVMPSLIRIFTGSEHPAVFVPNTEEQSAMAEQATDYVMHVLYEDNDGFLAIHSAFKDALTVKSGVIKWWTDTTTEITENEYQNITPEQLQVLMFEARDAQIVSQNQSQYGGLDVRIRWTRDKPIIRVEAVPPEEFRIDRNARTVSSAVLIGHERIVMMSDLVKLGYDPEFLADYIGTTINFSLEKQLRNPGEDWDVGSLRGIAYGEYFIRIDGDGDGIDELRKICTIGDDSTIVMDEVVDYSNFAVFCPDPRSHTVIGDSLADLTKDIQRVKTNVLRGTLDSLAQSIFARTVINEVTTNVDDALNQEIGAIIRTTGNVNDAVAVHISPFAGQQTLPMMEYIDRIRQSRTGISEASKGIDPRALQSTNVVGIDAIVTGAQERIELIARILAETGLKDLYKGILREVINNPNQKRTVKLRGKWAQVNPSVFDPTMIVSVNPTIGKGSDMVRLLALREVKETQMLIMKQFGVSNMMVTPIEFRNTIVDMLAIANIKNVSRYFKEISPAQMQAIAQAPKEPDPALMLAQAEFEKVRAKTAENIAKSDEEAAKNREEADFKRDKLNIEALLKAAEIISKYNAQVDAAEIKAENQPPKPTNGATQH